MFEQRLPYKVKVKIFKGKSGAFIAELPEYDIFTEADSLEELNFHINDLIFTYFEVPKEFQWRFIRYVPENPQEKPSLTLKDLLIFQQFIAPDAKSVLGK